MKNKFFNIKSKKGISVIVGYVLLITFSAVIGVIVFQWMRSYVPQDDLNCPYGSSLLIKNYTCSSDILSINLENNGKFDIGGYFIYATDSPEEELATIDLSKNNTNPPSIIPRGGIKFGDIAQLTSENTLEPNDEEREIYNLTGVSDLYSIEIVPLRWQEEKNKQTIVTCKDIKVRKKIECI